MSGQATSAGIQYQAHAIAAAYVAVIGGIPLPWFGPIGRTPVAVWAETRGPGDDVRIEFESGSAAEAQARHDMNAAGDLAALVADIRARSAETGPIPVALVVPPTVSRALVTTFPKDLDRLREGRTDGLHAELEALLADPANLPVVERLYVVPLDLDEPHSNGRVFALERLERRLVDPTRAAAAFAELVADALDLSANAGRRDRMYLISLLESRGYQLRPPERDERWIQELDWVTDFLLEGHYDQAALDRLMSLDAVIRGVEVSPRIRARAARLRTVALLRLARLQDAVRAAEEAIAFDPVWTEAQEIAARAAFMAKDLDVATIRADRAIDLEAGNAKAWAVRALIAAARESPEPTPPTIVADHPDYIAALLDIANSRGDAARVLELRACQRIDALNRWAA